jgi:hypothetical protein
MHRADCFTYTAAENYLGSKDSRPIANNTRLEKLWSGNFGIRLHSTIVVEIGQSEDGSSIYTLYAGGWYTVTTKDRINRFSPASVGSHIFNRAFGSEWCIFHDSDPRTPSKIQKCRVCHGTGQEHSPSGSYPIYRKDWTHSKGRIFYPARSYTCYRCNGKGTYDYGNNPIPTEFFDGITVDHDGRVIPEKELANA